MLLGKGCVSAVLAVEDDSTDENDCTCDYYQHWDWNFIRL